jgi:hypothetical protein
LQWRQASLRLLKRYASPQHHTGFFAQSLTLHLGESFHQDTADLPMSDDYQMDPIASRTATVMDGFTFPSNRKSSSPSNVNVSSLELHVDNNTHYGDVVDASRAENGEKQDSGVNGRAISAKESYSNGTRSPRTPVTPTSVLDAPYTPPSSRILRGSRIHTCHTSSTRIRLFRQHHRISYPKPTHTTSKQPET